MSQLLARLRGELDSSVDLVERAEISARIAGYFARLGRFDEARQVVGSVRQQFGQGQSGRVTVWLMLTEGLIQHYEELSPVAVERIRGAQMLGLAMGYSTIVALASAWKAHIEFERSNFESMSASIDLALNHVGEHEHDARTRIAIVLTNAFMICGGAEQSQRWFKLGHLHAVKNGDQASIDALLYNRAAFSMSRFRALNCHQSVTSSELVNVRMEVNSAKNLQHLVGVSALEGHLHLLEARLELLESKFDAAISTLQRARGSAPFAPHNFDQTFIELEICFASMMQGNIAFALEHLPASNLGRLDLLDIDERLVAAWMLAKMAKIDDRVGVADEYESKFKALWIEYSEGCEALSANLNRFRSSAVLNH